MKRYLAFSFLLVAALAFAAAPAFARGGGGHGGGHHGGGHHGGGHHGGDHGGNHHNGHHDHHHSHHSSHHHNHHSYHHHGDHHAFAHGWGNGHRGAWGWGGGGWGWGNPWAAAGWGAAAGWLGMEALDGTGYGYGYPATTQVVTSDNDSAAPADQVADTAAPETEYPAEEANQLANTGAQEPGSDAKFLPLGVYSIAPQGTDQASGLVQLAVSKEGVLRGTFVDAEDKDHTITGAVDKKTGRMAWTVAPNTKTVYHTTLQELTKESGPSPLLVSTEHGQAKWTIAHYTKDDEAEEADDKSDDAKDGDNTEEDSEDNTEESEETQPTTQIKTGARETHVPARLNPAATK